MRMHQNGNYQIVCPTGHPYILFAHHDGDERTKFFLASSVKSARIGTTKYDSILPVSMGSLHDIACGCREEITKFLRQFGSSWCPRDGMIFFKEGHSNSNDGNAEH
jgi:hypothetical protein